MISAVTEMLYRSCRGFADSGSVKQHQMGDLSPAGALQCPEGIPAFGGTGACQESQHHSRSVSAVRPLSGELSTGPSQAFKRGYACSYLLSRPNADSQYQAPLPNYPSWRRPMLLCCSDVYLVMLAGLVPAIPKGKGCLRGAWAGRVLERVCIAELRTMYGVLLTQSRRCA